MPKQKKFNNNKLKNKRGLGATPKEIPGNKGGGRIQTNFKIKWTRSTRIFYSALIVIPYLTALVITIKAGSMFVLGLVLLPAILVGLLYFVIRKIDQDDF